MGRRRSHSAFFSASALLAALSAANFFFKNLITSLIIKDDILLVECGLVLEIEEGQMAEVQDRTLVSLIEESEWV